MSTGQGSESVRATWRDMTIAFLSAMAVGSVVFVSVFGRCDGPERIRACAESCQNQRTIMLSVDDHDCRCAPPSGLKDGGT